MRIRFVTKAQLQVLQASKTEKHLMPDGPIPLFGSLPSAVSRQWGILSNGTLIFPMTFSQVFSVVALKSGDHGGGVPNLIAVSNTFVKIELEWTHNGQQTNMPNAVNVVAFGK